MKAAAERARRRVPSQPGYGGRFEPAPAVVDDPYERGKKLEVVINLRHDVLTHWRARGTIDDAEYTAGRDFQKNYEAAEIGAAGAMRYDKPRVDGGYPLDPLTEKVLQASQELCELALVLGQIDYALVSRVIGQGVTVEAEVREHDWGSNVERARHYVATRVRHALRTLAEHKSATGRERSTIRSWRDPVPVIDDVEEAA
jgi:hypothetical protein